MRYSEDEYLQLSGIQHFAFCRRQWALIVIEALWSDNVLTIEGDAMHTNAHDEKHNEKRGEVFTVSALRIASPTLGVSGQCDLVEFHADPDGVPINGKRGTWQPYPIEYKHGKSKLNDCDRLQLCAQAMCLEEMLMCSIPMGAIFYGQTHRREVVELTPELRTRVCTMVTEMHEMFERKHTPKVKSGTWCKQCSLSELCLPVLNKRNSARAYMEERLCENC